MARVGDGLAVGEDLLVAARRAAGAALLPLGGESADLAAVFVSGAEPEVAQAALVAASEATGARTTIGATAHGVMAAGRGVEGVGSVAVWAASLPGAELRAFHLEVIRMSESIAVVGMPTRRPDDTVGILLADPWSFPADGFVGGSTEALDGLPIVGGLASGAARAGETRLLVDGKVHERGAVGVVVGGPVSAYPLVSQGSRPIGRAYTVTAAEGNVLRTLAGQPALARAQEAVATLPEEERALAVRGLQLGIAMDEYQDEHGTGDFLARGVAAADETGALEVGDVVPVGSTVQFLLRDADAAHDDLVRVLSGFDAGGVAGALVFSCNGRGRSLFPSADHDVRAVQGGLGTQSVAGFFAAGEFGPVGGRNHVHGFTATVLAFGS